MLKTQSRGSPKSIKLNDLETGKSASKSISKFMTQKSEKQAPSQSRNHLKDEKESTLMSQQSPSRIGKGTLAGGGLQTLIKEDKMVISIFKEEEDLDAKFKASDIS